MSVDQRAFGQLVQKVANLQHELTLLKRAPVLVPVHSIGDLPKAVVPGTLILVPDATDGAVLAMSDGANWLELQPVGVIS